MIENTFDYALDKMTKQENESRVTTKNTSKKFHYNCSTGTFKKIFNLNSYDEMASIALTFQSASSTTVEIKVNNVRVVNENFSTFGFVNHIFLSDKENIIEISLSSDDAINNINIYFSGKISVENDDFLYDFNTNYICLNNGKSAFKSTIDDIIPNIHDKNYIDNVKNFDIAYVFSKNESLKNILAQIYIENNSLILKSGTSCEVEHGVKCACFVTQNSEQYTICYYKNGNLYLKSFDENLELVDLKTLNFSNVNNVEKLIKVSTMTPLNYFCIISSGVLYLADTAHKCRPLCQAQTANVFYHDGKIYVFANSDDVLNLYIFSATNFSKIKTICLKNYLSGFIFNEKIYAFNYAFVDEINE